MSRRLLLLNGLAILAVVCNHAAGWGYTAMFWWTDRYQNVAVPNFDQMGSAAYYALLLVKQLTVFSVPAFLFVSGFFIVYAARGNRGTLSWGMIGRRLITLLVPYVVWSITIFVLDAVDGQRYAIWEYAYRLATGGVIGPYYYVPLLCQFFVLAPWIIKLAKTRPRVLLITTALVQMALFAVSYLVIYTPTQSIGLAIARVTPDWLCLHWGFYFSIGVIYSLNIKQCKAWLNRTRWILLAVLNILAVAAVGESQLLNRSLPNGWQGQTGILMPALYALVFVLCFITFDNVEIPAGNQLCQLGTHSFGIYLVHPKLIEYVARVIYHVAPMLLAHQIIFILLLIVSGIGIPLITMELAARSKAHRFYRYVFG
jgi:probable poly-beta-1,6-N-acetyl-D-glucosamine export protein